MKDSLIGGRLGDYHLIGLLAKGGMARIYEGVDTRLGRHAAVKVLQPPPNAETDDTLFARFLREARAVAHLEHPHIISIYQYGEQDKLCFIAMKLIPGRDLQQELVQLRRNGQRMDMRRGTRILEQVASALDCAHAAGIVHRDVKPSNILLDASDRATLTDFGLVFQPAKDATLGTAFGTPRYIAPEQALASDLALPQSDIYALAIIAYEMLTGQTPFNGASPLEIALAHINDAPPSPRALNPDLSQAVESELLKALDKEPKNRHATAGEFVTALKHALDPTGEHTASTRLSSPTTLIETWDDAPPTNILPPVDLPAPTRKRRRSTRVPAIAAALIVVSAALLFAASRLLPANSVTGETTAEPATTVEAAAVEPAQTAAIVMTGEGVPARLIYSPTDFSLVNMGDAAVQIDALSFARGDMTFTWASLRRSSLAPETCLRVILEGRQSALPEGCAALDGQIILADPSRFFWSGEGETFEVRLNGEPVAACPSVARSGSGQCTITLPALSPPA